MQCDEVVQGLLAGRGLTGPAGRQGPYSSCNMFYKNCPYLVSHATNLSSGAYNPFRQIDQGRSSRNKSQEALKKSRIVVGITSLSKVASLLFWLHGPYTQRRLCRTVTQPQLQNCKKEKQLKETTKNKERLHGAKRRRQTSL